MKPLLGRPPADATAEEVEAWAESFAKHLISLLVEQYAEESQPEASVIPHDADRHLEVPTDTSEGGKAQL